MRLVKTRITGQMLLRLAGLTPLIAVSLIFLAQATLFDEPPHLSLKVSDRGDGVFIVTQVMPGGGAWDAGIRPGFLVVEFSNGIVQPGPLVGMHNLSSVVTVDPVSTRQVEADIRDMVVVEGIAVGTLWIQAILFTLTGALVWWLRGWDPASRRLLTLFGFFAVALSIGTFSGTRGGILPVIVVGVAISGTGYAMVSLLSVFPYYVPTRDWRRRYLTPAAGFALTIVWTLIIMSLWQPDPLFAVASKALGLYLAASVLVSAVELSWVFKVNPGRVRRNQIGVLAGTFLLGLGPLFAVALAPQLLHLTPSPLAVKSAAAFTLLVPVGISYTVIRYQSRAIPRVTASTLLPAVIIVVSFLVGILASSLVAPGGAGGLTAPVFQLSIGGLIAGAVGGALLIGSARTGHVAAEKMVRQAVEAERTRLLRDLYEGPVRTVEQLALEIQRSGQLPDAMRENIDKLIGQLRLMLRLSPFPQLIEAHPNIVDSVQRLANEVQRLSNIAILVTASRLDQARQLPPEVGQALYSVVQEGLANVVRHSQATEAVVHLEFASKEARLRVADNGLGFDAADWQQRPDYFGLQHARWTLDETGGWLNVESAPGKGTRLSAGIPLQPLPRISQPYADAVMEVDPKNRVVTVSGARHGLTNTEFRILWALVRHPGQAVSRDEIARAVWGPGPILEATYGSVNWHLSRLRRKIGNDPEGKPLIQTVRGLGYRYSPPAQRQGR